MSETLTKDEISVGDTIWMFDINHRVYEERHFAPVYEKHFLPHQIVGETPQSWLVEEFGREIKVNKKTMRSAGRGGYMGHKWFTHQQMEDDIWCHGKRPAIMRRVESATASELRDIARFLAMGFDA